MLKSPKRSPLALPLTALLIATLAACAHQTPTAETKANAAQPAPIELCAVWQPESYSRLHDTDETIRLAKKANAERDCVCNHICPKS